MADTGLPWELPYPLPTDLVRDGADAIKDLAEATATGLSNIPVLPGIGSNVAQSSRTTTWTRSSTASYVNIPDLDVSITPSSDTSRVLVLYFIGGFRLRDTATARVQVTATSGTSPVGNPQELTAFVRDELYTTLASAYLHSPGTASAVTYQAQVINSRDITVSRNNSYSTIIAIEVAP